LVLNKESVAPIETARGVLNFGFSAIHIKVHKGDSNAASSAAGNPAEQVLADELEAPGGPEDGSSINASLAAAFRFLTTNVGDESILTATIRSKVDEAIKLEVILKIEPNVRIRTPIRALSESVVKKFRRLPLADEHFHRPATIYFILGADVYPKVIQPGIHMVDEGLPVAQNAVFG